MRLMLGMAAVMEREDTTTRTMEVGEDTRIQHTVTRLALQEPRRTARRNNHARCARLLDRVLQIPDALRQDMMTGADILENAHRDQPALELVSYKCRLCLLGMPCSNWVISGCSPSRQLRQSLSCCSRWQRSSRPTGPSAAARRSRKRHGCDGHQWPWSSTSTTHIQLQRTATRYATATSTRTTSGPWSWGIPSGPVSCS